MTVFSGGRRTCEKLFGCGGVWGRVRRARAGDMAGDERENGACGQKGCARSRNLESAAEIGVEGGAARALPGTRSLMASMGRVAI